MLRIVCCCVWKAVYNKAWTWEDPGLHYHLFQLMTNPPVPPPAPHSYATPCVKCWWGCPAISWGVKCWWGCPAISWGASWWGCPAISWGAMCWWCHGTSK